MFSYPKLEIGIPGSRHAMLMGRYQKALKCLPVPGGGGCHPALLGVANLGVLAGVAPEQIEMDIRTSIPQGRRRVPDREIQAAVRKAVEECVPSSTFDCRLHVPTLSRSKPKPDGEKLRNQILSYGHGDENLLVQSSPIPVPGDPKEHTKLLLQELFRPTDALFIGDTFDKKVRSVAQWLSLFQQIGAAWPFIIPNPLDGRQHETASGTVSYRCDAAVDQFRFAIAEFDNLQREEQLRFWSGILRLRLFEVAALIDSGGKSIHAWLRVDCPDRNTWTRDVEGELFGRWLAPLGVDRACRNESRLSRLPGHFRQEKGRWQRLLYLGQSHPRPCGQHDSMTKPRKTTGKCGFCHAPRNIEQDRHPINWGAAEADSRAYLEPCPKCGSLELWQTVAGTWRCQRCDSDAFQRSRIWADRAEKLRAGKRLPFLRHHRRGKPVQTLPAQIAEEDSTKCRSHERQRMLFEGVTEQSTRTRRRRR